MEKFSIYDLLSLLLPGFVFIYFCNVLNTVFNLIPFLPQDSSLKIEIGIFFCLSLIAGAMLYAVNFWLIRQKWFDKPTKMYQHVAILYQNIRNKPSAMNDTLNKQAQDWFKQAIFYPETDWEAKSKSEKEQLKKLHDEFYDRAYYELEYLNKIDVAKTFQSFYFFFRQLATAFLMIIALMIPLSVASVFVQWGDKQPCLGLQVCLFVGFSLAMLLSVGHARWYRRNMVLKLYWTYFTHLNQKPNN